MVRSKNPETDAGPTRKLPNVAPSHRRAAPPVVPTQRIVSILFTTVRLPPSKLEAYTPRANDRPCSQDNMDDNLNPQEEDLLQVRSSQGFRSHFAR